MSFRSAVRASFGGNCAGSSGWRRRERLQARRPERQKQKINLKDEVVPYDCAVPRRQRGGMKRRAQAGADLKGRVNRGLQSGTGARGAGRLKKAACRLNCAGIIILV